MTARYNTTVNLPQNLQGEASAHPDMVKTHLDTSERVETLLDSAKTVKTGHGENSAVKAGQTRRGSLLESLVNILVGYSINFTANLLIFPLFGWHISTRENLTLGGDLYGDFTGEVLWAPPLL